MVRSSHAGVFVVFGSEPDTPDPETHAFYAFHVQLQIKAFVLSAVLRIPVEYRDPGLETFPRYCFRDVWL